MSTTIPGNISTRSGACRCAVPTPYSGGQLATGTRSFENPDSGAKHGFNLKPKLNDLLAKALKQTGQLKTGKLYDLDYDNQVQPAGKYDAENTSGFRIGVTICSEFKTFFSNPFHLSLFVN